LLLGLLAFVGVVRVFVLVVLILGGLEFFVGGILQDKGEAR
jgi:hypothetical protein